MSHAAFPQSYVFGVKAGDWIKYSHSSEKDSLNLFAKITVVSVDGPPKADVTLHRSFYVNWPTYTDETLEAYPVVQQTEGNWVLGMLIPPNSEVGDRIITGGPGKCDPNHDGTALILDETTGNYGGAMRSVLHASYSYRETQYDHYYDKQTGFLVREDCTTYLFGTETIKAVATNLWEGNANVAEKPSKWAVVIGVDHYDIPITSGSPYQSGPTESATQIYDILTNSFGFSKDHVNNGEGVLTDTFPSPFDDITSEKVIAELDWLKTVAGPDDTIFFYYAGHGDGNTDPTANPRTEYLVAHDIAHPIPDCVLKQKFDDIYCETQIIILDMSFSGGFIKDNGQWSDLALNSVGKPAPNRVVLTSCDELKSAEEKNSGDTRGWDGCEMAFTHFLIEGLKNDENHDGKISIEEAFHYARAQFPTTDTFFWILPIRLGQIPQMYDGLADTGNSYVLGKVPDIPKPILVTTFLVDCPVKLAIYDKSGNYVGLNSSGQLDCGFAAEFRESAGCQFIIVPNASGIYNVKLIGISNGDYNFTVNRIEGDTAMTLSSHVGTISKGQTIEYVVDPEKQGHQDTGLFGISWLTWPALGSFVAVLLLIAIAIVIGIRKRRVNEKA